MSVSHMLEEASLLFYNLHRQQKTGFPFSTKWPVYSRQLKYPVTLTISSTTNPGVSNLCISLVAEGYSNVEMLLDVLKYEEFIREFKMVFSLMGLESGFTNFSCYFLLWDTSDTIAHYHRQELPQGIVFNVSRNNVKWVPLLDSRNYYFLHST